MISNDEHQKRIDQIEAENARLKKLNDISVIREEIKQRPSLGEQLGIQDDKKTSDDLDKVATPAPSVTI